MTPRLKFLLPLLALLLLATAAGAVLLKSGEYLSATEIETRLAATYAYYGPGLPGRVPDFRRAVYLHMQPGAAALGSENIDQLHGENFSLPFANISGLKNIDEAGNFAQENFPARPPKLLILALDPAWFASSPSPALAGEGGTHRPSLGDGRVRDKRGLEFSDLSTLLASDTPDIGIKAITTHDGYDRFGAYHYSTLLSGDSPSDDQNFARTLHALPTGAFNETAWKKFDALLDFLAAQKIKTIILLPPAAPEIADATLEQKDAAAFMETLAARAKSTAAKHRLKFFNLYDPRDTGATSCEFIDGLRPGEIALDRTLLHIALEDDNLRHALKLPELAYAIAHNEGHASSESGEVDFLGLGCEKEIKK